MSHLSANFPSMLGLSEAGGLKINGGGKNIGTGSKFGASRRPGSRSGLKTRNKWRGCPMNNVTELKPSYSRKSDEGEPYVVWPEYYQAYRNWCAANGEKAHSSTRFAREIAKIVPDFESKFIYRKVDGRTVRVLMGYSARFPGGGV